MPHDRFEKETDAGAGKREASDVLAAASAAKAESRPSVAWGWICVLSRINWWDLPWSMKAESYIPACSRILATARPRAPPGWQGTRPGARGGVYKRLATILNNLIRLNGLENLIL
jgi:hypothetical protein